MQVYKQKAEIEVYKVKLRALVWLSHVVILEGLVCNVIGFGLKLF